MKLIEKYIIKQLILNSMLLLTLIISIIALSKSVQLIELSLNRGLPLYFFVKLIFLSLPAIIPFILPIIFCLSIFFTFIRMKNDSELIILESSGISKFNIARPVFFLGIIFSVLSLCFTIFLSPMSNNQFRTNLNKIKNDYSSSLLQEGVFNNIGNDFTIFLKQRSNNGELKNIFIHDTRNESKPNTLIAKKGYLISSGKFPRILLKNGSQQFFSQKDKKLSVLYFDKYLFNFSDENSSNLSRIWKTPSERSINELKNPNLENGDDRNNLQAFKAEIIQRFSLPLNTISFGFLIIAYMLSQKFLRVESFTFNLKVLTLIMVLKVIFIISSSLAIKNDNAELVNFLPSLIAFSMGVKYFIENNKKIV